MTLHTTNDQREASPERVIQTKKENNMTTETKNPTKKIPAFYIFEKGTDGNSKRIGAAFRHGKGSGMNIVINNTRYVAFPPKAKVDLSPLK
ncbi:MAG: hypothetical protein ABI855_12190 [Bacteroidota bacterium]